MPLLSLAHMAVLELTPPEVVACAAQAGFDAVNLRLAPAREGERPYPMQRDAPMLRETLAQLAGSGLQVLDVEVVWLRPDTEAARYDALFAAAQRVGARRVIAACADHDPGRATASFAAVCERAARHGLALDLEFLPFSAVRDLRAATRIVDAAAQSNAGLLIDALHLARSGTALDEVRAIAHERLAFWQLCDAPADAPATPEARLHEARFDRLLPGEGGLALRELAAALPPRLDVSVEIPLGGARARLSADRRARLMHDAARRFFAPDERSGFTQEPSPLR